MTKGRKKTNQEFVAEVRILVGDEYTFLEPYINAHTKIKVRHNVCQKVYSVTPNNFKSRSRCPYCYREKIKKTNSAFIQEVQELVGDEYTFLEPYVNNCTKIKVRHNVCQNTYLVRPGSFLSGGRCPYCSRKKTNEQFLNEVHNLVGNEYTLLEPYKGTKTKIKIKHNVCGNVYKTRPDQFLIGKRCPYCAGNIKDTTEEFAFKVYQMNDKISILGQYKNRDSGIKTRCNVCGNIWFPMAKDLLHGHGCPKCGYQSSAKKLTKSNKRFLTGVQEQVGDEYTFLEPYVNSKTKIKVRHNLCGTIYLVQPNSFLTGSRCPYCTSRSGGPVWQNILYTKETGWLDKDAVQHKGNN